MTRYKLAAIASIFCVTIFSLSGRGQAPPAPGAAPGAGAQEGPPGGYSIMTTPPLTRLEALAAQNSVLIVRGYTDIGTLNGDNGSSVLVSAVQFSDGKSKEHGVSLHVTQQFEGRTLETTAYVDEEEIDRLIEGVNTLAKLQDGGASPLQQFDARYRTPGALELVSANVNGGRVIFLRAMEIHPGAEQPLMAQAQFFVSRLPELAQRLSAAKEVLAKVKGAGTQ